MVGEIHLANILFTDASAAKLRPVLVLRANSFKDLVYLPLTTNLQVDGICIDNSNLQDGFLPKTSIVVYEKVGVIAPVLLHKRIGTLNEKTYRQVVDALIVFLKA